jgi:hypothetical protein
MPSGPTNPVAAKQNRVHDLRPPYETVNEPFMNDLCGSQTNL